MKIIIIGMLAIGFIAGAGHYDTHYTKKDCEVIAVTETEIVIEDPQKHIWKYETKDFSKGDIVTLKMYTNNTEGYIEDDVIIKVER